MKVNLFSPLLIILILTLVAKASIVFERVQDQTLYAMDTSVSSVLLDTAYAKDDTSDTLLVPTAPSDDNPKSASDSEPKAEAPVTANKAFKNHNHAITHHHTEKAPSLNLDNSEVKLLKKLSKRREELDKNQEDLTVREQVLKATENKIDQKMTELKSLQMQVEAVMKQYDNKEHSKILSLVKIYENMKPRDAAKIFDELDMPVLLQVVSNMKEIKVAPVIASMNPARARDLSIELARSKTIGN